MGVANLQVLTWTIFYLQSHCVASIMLDGAWSVPIRVRFLDISRYRESLRARLGAFEWVLGSLLWFLLTQLDLEVFLNRLHQLLLGDLAFVILLSERVETQQVLYLVFLLDDFDGPYSGFELRLGDKNISVGVKLCGIGFKDFDKPAIKEAVGSFFDVNLFLSWGIAVEF